MPTSPLDDPRHWRVRAYEIRALANEMPDQICRAMVLQLADDYERVAQEAEREQRRPRLVIG
jgi:hypothetical protein